jgi:hypothetical protein
MNGPQICTLCDLFDWDDDGNPVCPAFPGGIPPEIGHRGFDHRNEFPGDNGIRFVPRKGVTPEQVDQVVGMAPPAEEPLPGV